MSNDRTLTVLELAWSELAKAALGMIPARVVGQPDVHDFQSIHEDVEVIARKFNRLMHAYGEYAWENLSNGIDKQSFTDRGDVAVEEALAELTKAQIEHAASRYDTAADIRRGIREAV